MLHYIITFQSSYSQLIAASSLTRLISKNTTLPVEQRLDMREYLETLQLYLLINQRNENCGACSGYHKYWQKEKKKERVNFLIEFLCLQGDPEWSKDRENRKKF